MSCYSRARRFWPALLVFSVLLFAACGDDDSGPTEPPVTTKLNQGWDLFAEDDFLEALAKFEEALGEDAGLGDCNNGLGWTYLRLDSLDSALEQFDIAVAKGFVGADAQAGRCIVLNYIDEPRQAIFAGEATIAIDPFFKLEGDKSLDIRDVRLAMAQSYFVLCEYEESLEQLVEIKPANSGRVDPNSSTFLIDLIMVIEEMVAELTVQ